MLLVAYHKLSGRVKNMNKDCEINLTDFKSQKEDVTIQGNEESIDDETKYGNPFIDYFEKKVSSIETRLKQDTMQVSDELKDNRSYCPEFFIFIKKYLPEMPLRSGVLLGRLEHYRDDSNGNDKGKINLLNQFLSFSSANAKSEGYIEGAMRNLKQEDFPGKKCFRADTFVSENYSRIRRCLHGFGDRLHSCINPKKKRTYKKKTINGDSNGNLPSTVEGVSSLEKSYRAAEEKWGKKDPETPKQNPRIGQFQQSLMILLSSNPDIKKSNVKREICPSFLKSHCGNCNKSTKMPAKRKNKSAKEENVLGGVQCTSKGVFKNKKKHKPRLTKREINENKRKWTEWIYKHEIDE